MIAIREASPADAGALAELRWEFRSNKDPAVEAHDAFVERCTSWMADELTSGRSWRAWVAVDGGRIVGQLWLDVIRKVPNPAAERELHGYISNVYVRPDRRGGVGTRLLDAAIEWACTNGVDRVVLWPTARSVPLYKRRGFVREGDVLELTCR